MKTHCESRLPMSQPGKVSLCDKISSRIWKHVHFFNRRSRKSILSRNNKTGINAGRFRSILTRHPSNSTRLCTSFTLSNNVANKQVQVIFINLCEDEIHSFNYGGFMDPLLDRVLHFGNDNAIGGKAMFHYKLSTRRQTLRSCFRRSFEFPRGS